ncbi:hypothetical protein TNCV_3634061 [Trichonephila clavipes]|nr:hypothetical protein TNCV_3634061 [Trichonephila clavipes]
MTPVVSCSFEHQQVTVRFGSVPPQFRGEYSGGGQWPPTSLSFHQPHEYPHATKAHLQTSMSFPGFEPLPYGTTVSVAKPHANEEKFCC